jgi:hypothetical protein
MKRLIAINLPSPAALNQQHSLNFEAQCKVDAFISLFRMQLKRFSRRNTKKMLKMQILQNFAVMLFLEILTLV